ncbi:MAG: hypothetical protein AAGC71_07995 [Pseudomonadota bacterium]
MAKLLNNRWVVAVLALLAAAFVYMRIVAPLVGAQSPAVADDGEYSMENPVELTGNTAGSGARIAPADMKPVSTDGLRWNEAPERDPFAPKVVIQTADLTAVQDKISAEPVSAVTRRQSVPAVTAIVKAADLQYAVIDGEIRRHGDRIGLWLVRRIERDAVVLASLLDQSTRTVRVQQ